MYRVNEIFVSPQGEGVRAGILHTFVRFAGCNLACSEDGPEGFDCDTDFSNGVKYESAKDLVEAIVQASGQQYPKWVLFTGGEPMLQLNDELLWHCSRYALRVAVETNGTRRLPELLESDPDAWVCVSPKTAEHTLRVQRANELKYVMPAGRALPKPRLKANHLLLSPVFTPEGVDAASLAHCIHLIKENPAWRLSLQTHKLVGVR